MRSALLVRDGRLVACAREQRRPPHRLVREDRLVGDRMFASESDPVDVRHESAGWTDRWEDGHQLRTPDAGDDAVGGVAQRLQDRLDRHLRLVTRLRSEHLGTEPTALAELFDAAHRMRRDTESLLLLCSRQPGVRPGSPRRLADVLHDAASAAEEPRRIDVRSAPSASIHPVASVELLHVVAEVIAHVTAVYPGARVDLVSHVEPFGGITVDVAVAGAPRYEPDGPGRRRAATAEQLAQRSSSGVELRRSPDGPPPSGSAPVASVYCPAGAVTVEDVGWPAPTAADPYRSWGNGSGSDGGSDHVGNGAGRPVAPPTPAPAPGVPVDELFGPLVDLPLEPMDDRFDTPIFEAIASAWFREDPPEPDRDPRSGGQGVVDWETPSDVEWRAAAARAARPEPEPSTSGGLPRRRPGNQLVPPSRTQRAVPDNGPGERVPDRVRERLTTYQRGLRQGRHRAPTQDGPDPDDW